MTKFQYISQYSLAFDENNVEKKNPHLFSEVRSELNTGFLRALHGELLNIGVPKVSVTLTMF